MVWLVIPALANPQSLDSLTLESALTLAHQNNKLLKAAKLRIDEAKGDLAGASLLLSNNPELSITAGPRFPQNGNEDGTTDYGFGVEQRLEIGGQRGHRIDRAQAEIGAANANADEVRRVIDLAVATTYYDALAADHRLKLLQENELLAQTLFQVAHQRLNAGEGKPLEVNAAQIRLAETQRMTAATRAERTSAIVRLTELIGASFSSSYNLQGELPEGGNVPVIDSLVAEALELHPGLAAASHRIEAANAAEALANSEAWPDVTLGMSYDREEGNEIIRGGLGIPIPLFDRNQGERIRMQVTRERLLAEKSALELSIEAEIRQAVIAYEQAADVFHIYNSDVLRAQDESLELLQRSFEAGEVGIADVIIVQREVIEGRQGYLAAQLALARARAELLAAVGIPQTKEIQGVNP